MKYIKIIKLIILNKYMKNVCNINKFIKNKKKN